MCFFFGAILRVTELVTLPKFNANAESLTGVSNFALSFEYPILPLPYSIDLRSRSPALGFRIEITFDAAESVDGDSLDQFWIISPHSACSIRSML